MSDLGNAVQGVLTLLDMLGGVVRKLVRGDRTSLNREWRSRNNTWLGAATLLAVGVITLTSLLFFGCGHNDTARQYMPAPESEMVYKVTFDESDTIRMVSPSMDTLDPIRFLEFLDIKNGADRFVVTYTGTPLTETGLVGINAAPRRWLQAEHIDTLMGFLDDNSPTSPVYSVFASILMNNHQTSRGIEAVRLVEGFRKGNYPSLWPVLHLEDSASASLEATKQELRAWWYGAERNTQPRSLAIEDGTFAFAVAFDEWGGKSLGTTCNVIIHGDSVRVLHDGTGKLSGKAGDVLDAGILMQHKPTGKWIIGHKPEDVNAKEIGGCGTGPAIIDLKRHVFWSC